jgi:hypothetical protein
MYTLQRPGIFMRDKPILSSERMLHKDYDRKGSVAKKIKLVVSLKRLGAKTVKRLSKVTLTIIVSSEEDRPVRVLGDGRQPPTGEDRSR